MGKHRPLPADPAARKVEKWRRHLRCVHASKEKAKARAYYAARYPEYTSNLDLIGL